MTDDLLTTREAAERLGVTRGWVGELVHAGTLPGRRFGAVWMVRGTDVERYRRETLGKRGPKRKKEPQTGERP